MVHTHLSPTLVGVGVRTSLIWAVDQTLHYTYPNMEGNMVLDLGAYLRGTETLARVADYLGIVDLIHTRCRLNDPLKAYVIAQAFCAVIGAMYNDQGPQASRKLVHDFVISQLAGQDMHDLIKLQHPKLMLFSILKEQRRPRPVARLLRESGRLTHFPSFLVGVYSGGTLLAEGCGTSLKRAEKEAVLAALHKHFRTEMSKAPLPSDHDKLYDESKIDLFAKEAGEKGKVETPESS